MSREDFARAIADQIARMMAEMRPDNFSSMSQQEQFEFYAKGLKEQLDGPNPLDAPVCRPVGKQEAKAMLEQVLDKK